MRRFCRIFIIGGTERAAPPCGACRQMLSEFAPDLEVHASTLQEDGPRKSWVLSDLLPDAYRAQDLEGVDQDPL